jgi:hypothetical protein
VVFVPLGYLWAINKPQKQLLEPEFIQSYGGFYDNVKT